MQFLCFVLIVVLLIILIRSAHSLVDSAVKIARRLGVSELIIGLTVISLGTSTPELVVSLTAAIKGEGDISIANVVGSNIFNLGFVLGTVILVSPIMVVTGRKLVYRDGTLLAASTGLLNLFLIDKALVRHEGLIFIACFIGWLYLLFRDREIPEFEKAKQVEPARLKDFIMFALALAALVVSGEQLVVCAVIFAEMIGLSKWIIGMTIVAVGTSFPEIVTSVVAIRKKSIGVSVGNLVGSDIFNIVGILGIASSISSIYATGVITGSMITLWIAVILVVSFARTGWRFNRVEGAILVLLSLGRIVMDFFGLWT